METSPIVIENYVSPSGHTPFVEWLECLDDLRASQKVMAHLERVRMGNLGDFKSVGGGVYEYRIHWGPGFRIYFGKRGSCLIILLAGGDKSTQERDIQRAQSYWTDYWRRANETI